MGNQPIVKRTFMVKAGMTPQDVINSKEATAQQKKLAYVFDSDGVAGYSQREADVFNATLITDRGNMGISLWTRYQDGSKKETQYNGSLDAFKYSPKGDVKPYLADISTNNTVQKKRANEAAKQQVEHRQVYSQPSQPIYLPKMESVHFGTRQRVTFYNYDKQKYESFNTSATEIGQISLTGSREIIKYANKQNGNISPQDGNKILQEILKIKSDWFIEDYLSQTISALNSCMSKNSDGGEYITPKEQSYIMTIFKSW